MAMTKKPNDVTVRRNWHCYRNRLTLPLLITVCFLLFAVQGYTAQDVKETIAIFPFDNFSEDKNALPLVMPLLKNHIEEKGFKVVDEDSLNKFLLKERIRATGYVSRETATKLREELNVGAILVGSINSFTNGDNPHAGFTARLVRSSDNRIIWANHAAATGKDFITILGIGEIKDINKLAVKVLEELFDGFTIVPPDKQPESLYKIAVMPFQNKSSVRNAGKAATYMFIVELFKSEKFQPLEYGDIRSLIIELRVRDRGELDYKTTGAMSDLKGIDGIIVGTVEIYKEGVDISLPPEALISARLIDARNKRILWSDFFQSKGDDDIIMLDWGRIMSVEDVAYKVISKLVKEMGRVKWQ